MLLQRACFHGPARQMLLSHVKRPASSRRLASSFVERALRAPKGYFMPRIAVGTLAAVSAGAAFDLLLRWVSKPPAEYMDGEDWSWVSDWDKQLEADAAGELPPQTAAAIAAAEKICRAADRSVGRRHLIFVRHAQPGDGKPLSVLGERQAELTAARLAKQFGPEAVVFHSGAAEAKATAETIGRVLGKAKVKESPLLREGIPLVPSPSPEGLESLPEEELFCDAARAEGALRAHLWRPTGQQPEKTSVEVVVGHGNMIRYLVCRCLQLPPTAWSRMAANHGTVSWLEIGSDGSVLLREFGSAGHLSKDLLTYT
eukprot:TRINITY_DN74723_c0_g1_i1.p1 TRINITY_DN74723_c0_g1~~TRINITY_DN74723_c0_g1_i1.p1  ORF type:complete len:314 (-),score=58.32 TRINITY_DN74723_c0_g1_i1:59-1000(-)